MIPKRGKRRVIKKMKTKMTAIFAILMIALMAVGTVYALWSKTLYINGTVNTGTLDAKWSKDGDCYDVPDDGDISFIECVISADGYTLTVTVTNAYPSHNYYCPIDLENTGTIPLHIFSIGIDRGDLPAGATLEITPAGPPNLAESTVLNPGLAAYGTLHVHITDAAAPDTTYKFTITVTVENA
jgi:hypothetical protein